MRAIIFANGNLNLPLAEGFAEVAGDVVIAADGGFRNSQQMGIMPDVVVGDFDSLSAEEVTELKEKGVKLVQHPARKDYTDLELALEYAVESGSRDILVLGALGKRWDQTLANLLVATAESFKDVQIHLVDGFQEIYLAKGGSTLELTGQPGDTVSLIPLCGDASGITTEHLEYPLHNETLIFGATRGISNIMIENTAQITCQNGFLLIVHIHQGNELSQTKEV